MCSGRSVCGRGGSSSIILSVLAACESRFLNPYRIRVAVLTILVLVSAAGQHAREHNGVALVKMGGDELSNLAGSGAGDVRCAVLPIAILLVRAVAGNGEGNHHAAVLGIARRHISRQVAHQQTFREVAVDIMLNSGCAQVVEVLLLPIFLIAAGLETPGNHNALTLGQLGTQVVADELSRRTDGNETGILVLPTVHGKPEAGV